MARHCETHMARPKLSDALRCEARGQTAPDVSIRLHPYHPETYVVVRVESCGYVWNLVSARPFPTVSEMLDLWKRNRAAFNRGEWS